VTLVGMLNITKILLKNAKPATDAAMPDVIHTSLKTPPFLLHTPRIRSTRFKSRSSYDHTYISIHRDCVTSLEDQ
jgi:hypothetical protein